MIFWKKFGKPAVLGLLVALSTPTMAFALQSSSTTYGLDEAVFGSGGVLSACSSTYCSQQSAGENAVGNSASSSYQIQAGSNVTDRQPYIQFVINGTNTDIGTLDTTTTGTTTGTFSVKTYLAGGYTVINAAAGPKNGSYVLKGMTTAAVSAPGTEQFGINLVANTTGGTCNAPANFGANPAQAPDSTFGFGHAAPGYDTCGKFKYVNGDTIAYSNSSSGTTNYTISYIYNISAVTPGGFYNFQHTLVATSTY